MTVVHHGDTWKPLSGIRVVRREKDLIGHAGKRRGDTIDDSSAGDRLETLGFAA
jgi:hypothetical protein